MKRLTVLLLTLVVCAIGIAATFKPAGRQTQDAQVALAQTTQQQNQTGIIDGATHPELVPDRVAYSLLFRLISNRQTDEQKARIRGYIRQMGLGRQRCRNCPSVSGTNDADDDTDIDAMVTVAEEFQQRVSMLDQQAKALKEQNKLTRIPNLMAQLTHLQQQKDAIVDGLMNSLPSRLSANGAEKVRQHINERVKTRTKMDVSSVSR